MSASRKIQAAAWLGLLGLLSMLASGCGDSTDPGDDGGGGDLVTQQIGPSGGTVRTPDGQLTLIFPAGAVTQTQTITIDPLAANEVESEFPGVPLERAYRLGPDGLQFQQPVTVSIPSDQQIEQPDGSLQASIGFLLTSTGGQVEALDSVRLEEVEDGLALRGELSHFSLLVESRGAFSVVVSGVPTQMEVHTRFTAAVSVVRSLAYESVSDLLFAERDPPQFSELQAAYSDDSFDPIVPVDPITDEIVEIHASPLVPMGPELPSFQGVFTYTCIRAGVGGYGAFVSIGSKALDPQGLAAFGTLITVSKNITCVEPTITIEQIGSLQFDRGISAVALPLAPSGPFSSKMLVIDADGAARLVDYGNLASPTVEPPSPPHFQGVHDAFFVDFFGAPNPVFVGLRQTPPSVFFGEVPVGEPPVVEIGGIPARGTAIPGTNDFSFGIRFEDGAFLQVVHTGDPPRPSDFHELPSGSCPGDIAATTGKVVVVLTTSPNGTVDPQCTVNALAILDLTTAQVSQVPLGPTPRELALSPDGGTAYVTDESQDALFRIDVNAATAGATIPVGDGPLGVSVLPSGRIVVTNPNSGSVQLIDPVSGSELASTPAGPRPTEVRTLRSTPTHETFWVATDNLGAAQGIGSRFFTVANSGD